MALNVIDLPVVWPEILTLMMVLTVIVRLANESLQLEKLALNLKSDQTYKEYAKGEKR